MSYTNKTTWYGIPVIGSTQRVQSGEEQKAAQIVENQIRGIMRLFGDGVIAEGAWSHDVKDGVIRVILRPKSGIALEAVLKETYVRRKNPLTWSIKTRGKRVYLLVVPGDGLSQYPDRVQFMLDESLSAFKHSLALAVMDDTGPEPQLTLSFEGKKYIRRG